MNRHCAVVVLALSLTLLACSHASDTKNAPVTAFSDQGVGAQKRLSRYLQESVISPKLRECWGTLQGTGAVAIDLIYRKDGATWTFDHASATKSALPAGQDEAAVRCVEDAARATSFPVDQNEGVENGSAQFYVRIGVSVPLPAEGTPLSPEAIALIRGNGAGGVGDIAGCSECVSRTEYPYGLKCEARKSGGHLDCQQGSNSNICSTSSTVCLRGVWGGSSGIIAY